VKIAVLILALALSAHVQAPSAKSGGTTNDARQADPVLHADIVALFDLIDLRHELLDRVKQTMPEAKKKVMDNCQTCSQAFADEWERRMLARTDIDDYIAVYVKVYEKYFTVEDVDENDRHAESEE